MLKHLMKLSIRQSLQSTNNADKNCTTLHFQHKSDAKKTFVYILETTKIIFID